MSTSNLIGEDWNQHDPNGPILCIGSNMPAVEKGGEFSFLTAGSMVDDALANLEEGQINTLYWHDTLHNYPPESATTDNIAEWERLFEEYFDPLVAEGNIEWKTFVQMAELYKAKESTQ